MARRSGQSGTVVLKGLIWHGRYYVDIEGQTHRVRTSVPLGKITTMTKPEARRKLRSLLEQQGINSEERFTQTVQPGPTFAERAAWWEQHKLPLCALSYQDTRTGYFKSYLLPYFGAKPTCAIGETEVQEFITHLVQRGLVRSTINSVLATLKVILGTTTRNWHLSLPRPPNREPRFFTLDEMRRITEAAPAPWKVLFAFLAESGARFGEAAGLHAEDIDLVAGRVSIKRSVYRDQEIPPKTPAGTRIIYISPAVTQLLAAHLAGRTTGLVFTTKLGRPLRALATRRYLHQLLAGLNIPRGGLHAFRHGRVSVLQTAGVPLDLVKQWIGHSDLQITSRYTHFSPAFCQETAARLGLF